MDEMRLLDDFLREEQPSPDRLARARARLMEPIAGGPASAGCGGQRRPRRGIGRPGVFALPGLGAAVALGAAACLAVVATIAGNAAPRSGPGTRLGGHGRSGHLARSTAVPTLAVPPPPPPGASGTQLVAYVLDRAAAAAATAPTPGDGQFIYTDTHRVGGEGHGLFARQQTWQSVDGQRLGAVRVSKCFSPTRFRKPVPAKIPAAWIIPSCLDEIPILDTRHDAVYSDRTYAGLRNLPTAPSALLTYLEHHNSCDTAAAFGLPNSVAAYAEIYMILGSVQVLPAKVGAALFRAAAMIPGITVRQDAADAAGGRGLAVSLTYGPGAGTLITRHELFFDPRTYRFLGSQRVAVSSGAVVSASWLLSYRIVNSAPTNYTPAGPGGAVAYGGGASTSCE